MFRYIVKQAKLFSLPDIYIRLRTVMRNPDFTMAEITSLIASDPALTGRFLRLVNSPLYSGVHTISTIDHAVAMLGVDQIHDVVLSAAVADTFKHIPGNIINMRKFWKESYFCSVLARLLAKENGMTGKDRMAVIGLLHDLGHLVMYTAIPIEAKKTIAIAQQKKQPLYLAEKELLGFDYATVGGYLMQQWGLPKEFELTITNHIKPDKAKEFTLETALLHLSVQLTKSKTPEEFGKEPFTISPSIWSQINLTIDQCFECRELAEELTTEAGASFLMS